MNLDFFVSEGKLTHKGMSSLAADTAGCDTFTISFDAQWDGLVKLVVLQNGSRTAQVFYTGKTPLPRQVCGRGDLYLTCYGYRKKGDTVCVMQTLPMVRPVRFVGSDGLPEETAQPELPSAFAQMVAQTAAARTAARQAQQAAQQLLQWKEDGLFRGPAGPAATVQVESVRKGPVAQVENLGTAHDALLRFTLPYRDALTEQEKESICAELSLRMVGDLDAALDEILALQNRYLGEVTA